MVDKVNISTIQAQLKRMILKRFKNGDNDFFKSLKFGSNFDWEKYAKAINSKDESIFQLNSSDSAELLQEKSFMQLVNELFQSEDVLTAADIDTNKEISAQELEKYFNEINSFDGNGEDISFDDFAQFIQNKNIDLDKVEKAADDMIAAKQAQEAQTAQAAQASAGAGGSEGGGGGGGGGGESVGGGSGSYGSYNNPNTETAQAEEDIYTRIDKNTDSFKNISSQTLTSSDIADSNNVNMQKIPPEERQKLLEATQNKEDAKTKMDNKKADVVAANQDLAEPIEEHSALVETLAQTNEQLKGVSEQKQLVQTDIDTLNTSITNLGEQISSCQSAMDGLEEPTPPSGSEDDEGYSAAYAAYQAELAAYHAAMAALEAQMHAFETEQEGQKEALKQAQTTFQTLEAQETQLQTSATEMDKQIKTLEENIDELKGENAEMVDEYMQLKTDYSTACTTYNEAKQEAMAAMRKAIEQDKNDLCKQNNENYGQITQDTIGIANRIISNKSADGVDMQRTYEMFHELLETGNDSKIKDYLNDESIPQEQKDAMQKMYNTYFGSEDSQGFSEEQKEKIKEAFGSEDNFFRLLSMVKDFDAYLGDSEGNYLETISYKDLLLNPENYTQSEVEGEIDAVEQSKKDYITYLKDSYKSFVDNPSYYITSGYVDPFDCFMAYVQGDIMAPALQNMDPNSEEYSDTMSDFFALTSYVIYAPYIMNSENFDNAKQNLGDNYYMDLSQNYYEYEAKDDEEFLAEDYQSYIDSNSKFIKDLIKDGKISADDVQGLTATDIEELKNLKEEQ